MRSSHRQAKVLALVFAQGQCPQSLQQLSWRLRRWRPPTRRALFWGGWERPRTWQQLWPSWLQMMPRMSLGRQLWWREACIAACSVCQTSCACMCPDVLPCREFAMCELHLECNELEFTVRQSAAAGSVLKLDCRLSSCLQSQGCKPYWCTFTGL